MAAKNKKVLVVGPYPPPFSGPEMAIKAILESPIKSRFCVRHLSTNVRSKNRSKGRIGLSLVAAFIAFVSRLFAQLVKFRPDVVYYFVTATRMGWLGRDIWCIWISRLFGARVVTHMRAGHFRHNLSHAKAWEVKAIQLACRRVSWSLVQSPSLKNQFEGLAPKDRIRVIPNMIDTHLYASVTERSYQQKHLLFLGHLSEAKGYCDLLATIPTVVNRHPDVVFSFAGARLDRERNVMHDQVTGQPLASQSPDECYATHIAGRYEANYEYLGVLNEEKKLDALKACDFLLLPSYSEGFSMAVLEALAIGKPVVCTAVGAMRDFLQTGVHGEIIQPGDTDALATAILRLLDDRTYRDRVARHNAEYARQEFSQAVVAQQLGEIWQTA